MSQETARICQEEFKKAIKDYPTHLLFCSGEEDGFASLRMDDNNERMRLEAQIFDTLYKNPSVLNLLIGVIAGIQKKRSTLN